MNYPAMIRRDPFFGALLYAPFGSPYRYGMAGQAWAPAAEIVRDGDDAVVRLELPGLSAEDIKVETADGRLVVSGEKRDQHGENRDGFSLRETRYGSFRRTFKLPADVGTDAISATYDAGVLTVRVGGVHASTSPRLIPVQAGPGRELPEAADGQGAEQPTA